MMNLPTLLFSSLLISLIMSKVHSIPLAASSQLAANASTIATCPLVNPQDVIPEGANVIHYDWNITVETKNIDGFYRQAYLTNGYAPGPLIEGDQGDWVVLKVRNFAPTPITIHFHGLHQRQAPFSDGASGVTQWPILSGDTFTYVLHLEQYGLFWYHNHYRGYSNDGLSGPIYIRPNSKIDRPYHDVVSSDDDYNLLLELEKQPQLLLFSDWFKDAYDIMAGKMFGYGMGPTCLRSFLTNGKARHLCYDKELIRNEAVDKLKRLSTMLEVEPDTINIDDYGCLDLQQLNGFTSIEYDKALLEFPGYNNDCKNSTTDREIIYTKNQKYIMFNTLNLGGEFAKMLSIDDHNITVVAVDGTFVTPKTGQQLYLPIGQRVTAIVETDPSKHEDVSKPFAIRTAGTDLAQIVEGLAFLVYGDENQHNSTLIQKTEYPDNGSRFQDRAATPLSNNSELVDPRYIPPHDKSLVPPSGPADKTIYLYLNSFGATIYTVRNNITMNAGMELDYPALFQIAQDPTRKINLTETISQAFIDEGIKKGDVVDIIYQNAPVGDHPMHLHGHTFWVIGYNDSIDTFAYNSVEEALNDGRDDLFDFKTPAYVDNISVLAGGYTITRMIADNPGAWMIHCHIQTHLAGGMGAVLIEAKEDIADLPTSVYDQAHANYDSMHSLTPSELNVTLT